MDLEEENTRSCPHCSAACADEHQYCPACGFPIGTMGSVTDDKFVGRTLPGGHHILDLISVGGMGRVYRAEQSVLGRTVAVKIIHPHLLSDENSAARFLTEARAASQLNHPNSVSVFDFGKTDDGQPYLVMEFLRGKDLARVTYEEGPLSFARIVDVLGQTLGALGEAHDLGIVHRDLKPENIILEPLRRGGDFVKVVDFGLAKLKADAQSTSVTSPGIVCGTPDYMAPEQGRGDEIDGRADLYAVGVILFQLLTGRLPFEAESPTQVVMMHLSIPVPDPRQIAPERGIPDSLVDVTMTALEKDFTRRYQDAHEFAEALSGALKRGEGVPIDATQVALPDGVVECPSCGRTVPQTKFCGECATPLPRRSALPGQSPRIEFPLPLTARDDALAWLVDRRQAVLDSFVGARVVGDPGLGKTRLIQEFVARQRNRGDFVVCTGPDPFWAQVAYHAVRSAVRDLARLSELDIEEARFEGANPDARRGLIEIFAGKPAAQDQRAPQERRHGLAQALIWALGQAALFAEPHGVIVVVDDLDRIDTASRWALADALAAQPNFGVLFLAAHAPGFESGWGADQAAARVLSGLSSPVAATLVPARPVGLLRFDEGRPTAPMYVEQVLRYSLDGGSDPPSRLADLIALRVDTLAPAARRALQALAVLGDRIGRGTLAELLPKDDELELTVRELGQSGLVIEMDETVSTAHPLLREIVLGGIPVGVRRELHAKALGVGEKSSFPIEASAQHAYFAQESFQALLLLEQVADRAKTRGDVATEVLALRRALEIARLEIARGQLDDPLRAVLIFSRKLGASLTRAGDFADAEGVLQEALDIAGPSGPDRARVLSALAQVARSRNRGPEALGYIDQAIDAARQSNAHDLVDSLSDTRRAWAS